MAQITSNDIYAGRDVKIAISSKINDTTTVVYQVGSIDNVRLIMDREVSKYQPLGVEEPVYRRGSRTYQYSFGSAVINTKLYRLFAGKKRGSNQNWNDLQSNQPFEDGFGNIFDDYPEAVLIVELYNGVGEKRIFKLSNLHPNHFEIKYQSGTIITCDTRGFAEDISAEDQSTTGSAS